MPLSNLILLAILVSFEACYAAASSGGDKSFTDCSEVRAHGLSAGPHPIRVNKTHSVEALCDFTLNNSYTIIQQRINGNENFYRGWHDYQYGFGMTGGDFWIGLAAIEALTNSGNTVLDVQLQDWAGNNRAAHYKYFALSPFADRYRMQIAGFSGNVPDDLSYSNNMQFSTYDYPDYYKCAVNQKAGWWYNYCAYALHNGIYYHGGPYTPTSGFYDGIYWKDWGGYGYSLRFTRFMLSKPIH